MGREIGRGGGCERGACLRADEPVDLLRLLGARPRRAAVERRPPGAALLLQRVLVAREVVHPELAWRVVVHGSKNDDGEGAARARRAERRA